MIQKYPLTPMQLGLLFHALSQPKTDIYHVVYRVEVQGNLSIPLMRIAWEKVIKRHPALRIYFNDDQTYAIASNMSHSFEYIDNRSEKNTEFFINKNILENISIKNPSKLIIVQQSEEYFDFIWAHHHILIDGWSVRLVIKDLFFAYEQLLSGNEVTCVQDLSYEAYVKWLNSQSVEDTAQYWKNAICDIRSFLSHGVKTITSSEADQDEITIFLSESEMVKLQKFRKECMVSLSTIIQVAWAILLSFLTGSEKVVYGLTFSGRSAPIDGIENMVGLLINTLPFCTSLSAHQTIAELLKSTHLQTVEISEFIYTPLSQIQSWCGGGSLFDHIMVIENYPDLDTKYPSTVKIRSTKSTEKTDYPLSIIVDFKPTLTIKFAFKESFFDRKKIEDIALRLKRLLLQFEDVHQPIKSLLLIHDEEKEQLLNIFSNRGPHLLGSDVIDRIFSKISQQVPSNTALIYLDRILTYQQLDNHVNKLALCLAKWKGKVIGVNLSPSFDLIITLLAIFRSGAVYLPLDTALPKNRILWMAQESEACLIITDSPAQFADYTHGKIRTTRQLEEEEPEPKLWPVKFEELAYIIYTSGSTGAPKAVMCSHGALSNRLHAIQKKHPINQEDVILFHTSINFDVSLREILWPLLHGAVITIAPSHNMETLVDLIYSHSVSIIDVVPSVLEVLLEYPKFGSATSLQSVFVGGDVLKGSLVRRFYETGPKALLYNIYGPTETTIDATVHLCNPNVDFFPTFPLGRPYENTEVYILDSLQRPVCIGMKGELYLGGNSLACGYQKDDFLTSVKFINHPFSGGGENLYKTGDIVRFLPNGSIEFIGRTDQQIKLRGIRIDLQEIATTLEGHSAILSAEVILHENEIIGKFLVAYIVSHSIIDSSELRGFLESTLPSSMVPSAFVFLKQFPLKYNGKIDRQELKNFYAPQSQALKEKSPPTDLEKSILQVWEEVLNSKVIHIDDNIFDFGAHSLLIMKVSQKIYQITNIRIPLLDFFKYPTIRTLAKAQESTNLPQNKWQDLSTEQIKKRVANRESLKNKRVGNFL